MSARDVVLYITVGVNLVATFATIAGVLMHSGRGGGLSDMFGGGSGAALGSSAAERNLNRITFVCALVWIITVLALVDPTTNLLAEPLEFISRGFVHDDHTFDGASAEVEKALERAAGDRVQDVEKLEGVISNAVSRYIQRTYRREPVVIAIVVDA